MIKKTRLLFATCFVSVLMMFSIAHGEKGGGKDSDLQSLDQGLQFYKDQKYQEAADVFAKQLESSPENSTFLLNLGLTSVKLDKPYHAAAYFRKAREIDPYSQDIRAALSELNKQFRTVDVPRQISNFDFLEQWVRPIPSFLLFLLCLIATSVFGVFLVRWARAKKLDQDFHSTAPLVISCVAVLVCCFAYGFKLYERSQVRGTILVENLSVKSVDNDDAPEITQFHGGMEVRVFEKKGDWLKIQYPGSFLGWAKADSIMITTLTSPSENH